MGVSMAMVVCVNRLSLFDGLTLEFGGKFGLDHGLLRVANSQRGHRAVRFYDFRQNLEIILTDNNRLNSVFAVSCGVLR